MTMVMNPSKGDSDIVYLARLNAIIFFWPVALIAGGIFLTFEVPVARQPSLIFIGIGIIWVFMTWVTYLFSSLTIKQKRVILRTGIIVRQTIDIPLNKIESIDIRQSLLGSLLKYGALVITGTGGTRHLINYINRPLTCRRHIEQLMHNY